MNVTAKYIICPRSTNFKMSMLNFMLYISILCKIITCWLLSESNHTNISILHCINPVLLLFLMLPFPNQHFIILGYCMLIFQFN